MIADSYDCIVIGAGPAGCTAATMTAQAGFSTLLLEREKVPRFHIGESLMPETYWTLERIGALKKMQQSSFPKKYSVQFYSPNGRASQPFYFHHHDTRECSQTWQVLRSDFDKMLFENAAEHGAQCHDQTRVLEVEFEGDRAVGVTLQHADGSKKRVGARVVIDASGQQSLIANRLGIRRIDPELKKAAVWTYFRDAVRDPGIDAGATLVLRTTDRNGWFWFIPVSDDVTSIGVVADSDYLLRGRGEPAAIFAEELAKCPPLAARVANSPQVDQFRVLREFSYSSDRAAGDGWVLVGDAFRFIDPVYSSGVFLALKSGELAADCVVDGLKRGDTSAAQLGSWAPGFVQGAQWIHNLVTAYYDDRFSFGKFIKEHPHHRGSITDVLIGRVFHASAGDVFRDMDQWISQRGADENGSPATMDSAGGAKT